MNNTDWIQHRYDAEESYLATAGCDACANGCGHTGRGGE